MIRDFSRSSIRDISAPNTRLKACPDGTPAKLVYMYMPPLTWIS